MNWSNVRLILAREIRDQLRDRRTMFMIVVLPILLYPLLGMAFLQIAQFVRETPTRVWVIGARTLPEDPPLLEGDRFAEGLFKEKAKARLLEVKFGSDVSRDEAAAAVLGGQYEAALYFPPDFGNRLRMFREALRQRAKRAVESPSATDAESSVPLEVPQPEVIYSTANEKSQITSARLSEVLRRWSEEVRQTNLAAAGVPQWATQPFKLAEADVAKETGTGGAAAWSKVLPVLLLLWAMTGAFYPAVDLCAGEKERGTLETLLSSPARRSEIVLGKLVTIMLFSVVTAVLNIVSILIMGEMILRSLPGFGPIPVTGALWMALALVPASALFSALCLALAAFARSTKEGQYYLVPLLFVTLPLAVLPATSGMELNLGNSLIPVTGLVLLLRTALEGNAWEALEFLPTVTLVTLGACLLAIRWAVEQFNSESVLFRESERIEIRLWMRRLVHDRQPTPGAGAAVLCGAVTLFLFFYMNLSAPEVSDFQGLARSLLVTQLAVILTPALLMTVMLTTSPRKTLLLRWPAWTALLAAPLLAVVMQPLVHAVTQAVFDLYPMNPGIGESLEQVLKILGKTPFWPALLVVAVLPAVCEELAFRGFILSGFRRLGHKYRAIIFTAILFGLVHAVFQRTLVSCLLGVVIGFVAVQTGSILPGMLFHAVHNGLLMAMQRLDARAVADSPAMQYLVRVSGDGREIHFTWPAVVVSAAAMLAILYWFQRLPHRRTREERRRDRIAKGLRWDG